MVFHEVPNISLRKAFNTMFLLLVESVLGGGGEGVLQEYYRSTTGVQLEYYRSTKQHMAQEDK